MNYSHALNMLCAAVLLCASRAHSMEDDTAKNFVQGLVRGSVTGIVEVVVDQPLVDMKNRLQRGEKLSLRPTDLYRGFGVNAGSMMPITAVQMGAFELAKRGLQDEQRQDLSDSKKLLAATGAGAFSASVGGPSELLMIQQQKNKATLAATFSAVKKQYGFRIFKRAISCAAVRDGGFTAGYLAGGPALSKKLTDAGLHEPLATVAGGAAAGLVAAGVTHSADTIKTKLQADLAKERYTNVRDVYRQETMRTLYAGFTPRATRVIMATTVMSAVNKELEKMMVNTK